jgi:hypothetical protein
VNYKNIKRAAISGLIAWVLAQVGFAVYMFDQQSPMTFGPVFWTLVVVVWLISIVTGVLMGLWTAARNGY